MNTWNEAAPRGRRCAGSPRWLLWCVVGVGLTGCVMELPVDDIEPVEDPPGPELCLERFGVEMPLCVRNIDCAVGASCDKPDDAEPDDWGCCRTVTCTGAGQCPEDQQCMPELLLCLDRQPCGVPGGAVCDPGERCSWDGALASCRPEVLPASCEIAPASLTLAVNKPSRFEVLWLAPNGDPMPPVGSYSATSDVAEASGNTLTGVCEGEAVCEGTVEVTAGEASCSAAVRALPTVVDGRQIQVIDGATGAPLDATLHLVGATDAITEAVAGGRWVSNEPLTLEAVTASAPGYRTLTFLTPPEGDLLLPLTPTVDQVAGLRGTLDYSQVTQLIGDVKTGLAGLSIARSVLDLDLDRVFGPDELRLMPDLDHLVGEGEQAARRFPTGVSMLLGNLVLKDTVLAVGEPGRRLVWSLGTRISVGDAYDQAVSADTVQAGLVVSLESLVTARLTYASASGSLTFPAGTLPAPDDRGVRNYAAFEEAIALAEGAVGLQPAVPPYWSAELDVPTLPCVGPEASDCGYRALILVGVDVPGRGFVPMGIASAADAAALGDPVRDDGVLSRGGASTAEGLVTVAISPPQRGLEERPLRAVLMAFGERLETNDGRPAAIMQWPSLVVGERNPRPTAGFGQPVSASLSDTTVTFHHLNAGPDLLRVNLSHGEGQPWEIIALSPPDEVGLSALLPDEAQGAFELRSTQAIALQSDAPSPASLMTLGEGSLVELGRWTATSVSDR